GPREGTRDPPWSPQWRVRLPFCEIVSNETVSKESPMYPTKNDLPEALRSKVIEVLNARLADAIDLQTQCKQAHWNVKGPNFIALHKLFDEVNEDVEEY